MPGDRHGVGQDLRPAAAFPHPCDDLLLGPERPPRGEVPGLRPDQVAVLLQPPDRRSQLHMRMTSRITAQCRRQKVGGTEHAVPLLQVVEGLPGRLERREARRRPRQLPLLPVETDGTGITREPERLRLPLPHLREHLPAGFVLLLPRRQRRPSGVLRRVVDALRLHVAEDILPPGREGVEEGVRISRELEPRQPAHRRRRQHVAEFRQFPRQFVPVPGPDQPAVAVEQRRLDAPPRPVPVPCHVGDHRVGVKLGIVVAARHVAEGGRDHAVGRLAWPSSGRGIVTPCLEELRLDPVERRPDRPVMGAHHPFVALEQRLERDRFRGGEGQVPSRAVLVLARDHPSKPDVGSRDMAGKDGDEFPLAHALRQAEGFRSASVPAIGRPVGGIIPGQVFVQEVAEGLLGADQLPGTGEHQAVPGSVGGSVETVTAATRSGTVPRP